MCAHFLQRSVEVGGFSCQMTSDQHVVLETGDSRPGDASNGEFVHRTVQIQQTVIPDVFITDATASQGPRSHQSLLQTMAAKEGRARC